MKSDADDELKEHDRRDRTSTGRPDPLVVVAATAVMAACAEAGVVNALKVNAT